MSVDELVAAVPLANWPDAIASLSDLLTRDPLPQSEFRELFRRAIVAVDKGRKHTALALFVAGLLCDQKQWTEKVRRQGLLRPSKQRMRRGPCDHIVSGVLQRSADLGLRPECLKYFDGIRNLNLVDREVHTAELNLQSQIRNTRLTALRSCLVLVELWFFAREIAAPVHADDPTCEWAEALADGFSFLYYLFSGTFPVSDTYLGITSPEGVLDGKCLRILMTAKAVRESREWEILVEHLGYRCFREDGTIIVEPSDASLEKSIRLGYIMAQQDKRRRAEECRLDERVHLIEIAQQFHAKWNERGAEFVSQPFPRVRFHIPEIPEMWSAISEGPWFSEELSHLQAISEDMRVPVDQLLESPACDGLTFRDLFILQRFIGFVRTWINLDLKDRFVSERALVVNSLVPVFKTELLARVLAMALPENKVGPALRLLTWSPESKNVFDVIYQPLVVAHGEVHVPFNLLGSANIVRNTLQLTHRRIDKGKGSKDPLENSLADVLGQVCRVSRSHVSYQYNGVSGDLDAVAVYDGILFAFECKGSLHPCNAFELRALYDLLLDAQGQLDRLAPLFQDSGFLEYLGSKIACNCAKLRKVVLAIVVGDHLFAGWRAGPYAVRSINGVTGFITSGVITVAGQRARMRPEGPVTADALYAYFADDHAHSVLFDSMEPAEAMVWSGKQRVILRSFVLNWVTLAQKLGLDGKAAEQWIRENEHLVDYPIPFRNWGDPDALA